MSANALSITNAAVGADSGGHRDISFSIYWEHSWCDSGAACNGDAQTQTANWDAVWLFAKFSKWDATNKVWGAWTHCTLSSQDSDHTLPTGGTPTPLANVNMKTGCTPATPCGSGTGTGKGVYIYRGPAMAGSTNSWTGAAIHWLATTDGINSGDTVRVKVFGTEMVYIPQGDFSIGDTDDDNASNFQWKGQSPLGAPTITDTAWSNAITASSVSNSYDDTYLKEGAGAPGNGMGIQIKGTGGIRRGDGTTTNASFPTGWTPFYIMKYELSSGQYRDFLNTLTRAQQNNRIVSQVASRYMMSDNAAVSNRSVLRNPSSIPAAGVPITFGCDLNANGVFNESADGEWIAANFMSWMDLTAYADWAALRPMTELEFEKAARGPQAAVNDEYAWGGGDATINPLPTSFGATTAGSVNEAPNQGNVNITGSTGSGPYRVGSFAKSGSATRQDSGASYYGVLDLSGNLWERAVTVGENTRGRTFTGSLGDGVLTTTLSYEGNAENTDWPGIDGTSARGVTGATGSGFRGGNWYDAASSARVSDRILGAYTGTSRYNNRGARCARTSP